MVNVYIKGVDSESYKKAKIMAIQRDETIGELFSEAVETLFKTEEKPKANRLREALGMLGKADEKALEDGRKKYRDIREELGRGLDERMKRHGRS